MAMLAGLLLTSTLLTEPPKAEKSSTPAEKLQALKQEHQKMREEFDQAYEKAQSDKERQELRDEQSKRIHTYARRALELGRKNTKDTEAVEALSWIIGGGLGYQGAGAEIESAFDLLRTDYATSDKLRRVCWYASIYDSVSTKPERFLRTVLAKNPHREIQGYARYHLGRSLRSQASWVKRLRDPAQRKKWEMDFNTKVEKRIMASDPDKLLREAEKLLEQTIAKYGDVETPSRRTLGDLAKAELFEMRYLVVGKVAPEIEGEDLDGKPFKLSDYRGKVVVLDFWGNW
jgi:AhpC/TSA family protein